MVAFTEMIPGVQLEIPNCPRPVMIDAIRQSCIEFCAQSRYWRYEIDPVTTVLVGEVLEPAYELPIPAQTRVISVRSLSIDDEPLAEYSMDALDADDPGWRTATGRPSGYAMRDPATIVLDRGPAEGSILTGTVCLKPSQDALTVGEIVYDDYREALVAGAISRLRLQRSKEWFDERDAEYKRAAFTKGIESAAAAARAAYATRRRLRARPSLM